ncbi:MAG TPA: DUF2147 domain-containing protein [Sediminibacterium sp.]|nr:DUF2147 domain-containing protein [Sediminibacterium sp.]
MKKIFYRYMAILILLTGLSVSALANNPDAIIGLWKPAAGNGVIQIYKQGSQYYGKLVWLKEPNDPATGKPKTDTKNSDNKLKSRPLLGMVNLRHLKYAKENNWNDGKVYDPKSGNDYSCKITMIDENTIEVRGFMGISLLGKTDTWNRQKSL